MEMELREAIREDMFRNRQVTLFDGKQWHRQDGLVHFIDGAVDSQPSPMGWWLFFLRCHKTSKFHHERKNHLTDKTVTCLACLAIPERLEKSP